MAGQPVNNDIVLITDIINLIFDDKNAEKRPIILLLLHSAEQFMYNKANTLALINLPHTKIRLP